MSIPFIPEKISVVKADGTHAYWVSADQARRWIREQSAVGLGNARKFYAIRMLDQERLQAEKFTRNLRVKDLAGVPIIRPQEMLAPSPRRNFGFEKSVNRRLQGSAQHGKAPGLVRWLKQESGVAAK